MISSRRTKPIDISDIPDRFPSCPGVYLLLDRGTKTVVYVGRTSVSLSGRAVVSVLEHNIPKSALEQLEIRHRRAQSDYEAYCMECEYFHRYDPMFNQRHPASPREVIHYCPNCGV